MTNFNEFLKNFKKTTENRWSTANLDSSKRSYQIQPGTVWLQGHSDAEIKKILEILNLENQKVDLYLIQLLKFTKGLDLPQINLNSPDSQDRYIQNWKLNIDFVTNKFSNHISEAKLNGEYNELNKLVGSKFTFIPIYAHRSIVMTNESTKVYSIYGSDIVLYGDDIQTYLTREFL
mgnify:CR=1 FL=1